MKKLITYILFLVFFAVICVGEAPPDNLPWLASPPDSIAGMIIRKISGGAVSTCPEGTYDFAIDFDHNDGNDYACDSGGTSYQKDASGGTYEIDAAYGNSGNGFRVTALDEYLEWNNDFNLSANEGTIWMGVYVPTTSSLDPIVVEIYEDADDYLSMRLNNTVESRGDWSGAGTTDITNWSGTDFSQATWTRVGITWDEDLVNDDFCVVVDAGSWECDSDNLAAFGSQAALKIIIGENHTGLSGTTVWIDDVYYINSFQASDPHGVY